MAYKTIDGITSSIIPFYLQDGTLFVMLGQRGRKSKAFANSGALVGGSVPRHRITRTVCRPRLKEETGVEVSPMSMKLVTVQSDPKRDPRGQIIDTVWSTLLRSELPSAAADDLQAVAWYPLSEALNMDLAFDHQDSLRRFAAISNRRYPRNQKATPAAILAGRVERLLTGGAIGRVAESDPTKRLAGKAETAYSRELPGGEQHFRRAS